MEVKRLIKAVFSALLVIVAVAAYSAPADTTQFKPKPIYGKEAKVVAFLLDNNHYRKLHFNDSLSSVILDRYIKSLDNNKSYFLATDLTAFEKYRNQLDDLTRAENVDPAYVIYNVFRKRFIDRINYVIKTLVPQKFDYSTQEFYETDRDKEPWCKTEAELNEIWRKVIKSQALSLKLAGKSDADIQKTLTERYERLVRNYTREVDSGDVFEIYMNSITEAYDPHTNYLLPSSADRFKQSISVSLEGIGARLQNENDYTKIVEIITGGPAEKSGLVKVNDRITAVAQGDGEFVDVVGWRIDDVVKLIKGPKGTKVRLQVLPAETGIGGATREIQLIRDKIKLEDQMAKKKVINYNHEGKDMRMGVITLPSFYMDYEGYQKGDPNYASTTRDVQRLIKELQVEGIDGIVLDLRNNGGGSLAEAIDLTGLFIKDGPVVQVKNSANRIEVGSDDDPAVIYGGPLVVMTNRFSASASEIFAGAIQDYHRGVVVGESTYGKGTVQTVIDLNRFINDPNNQVGELKLTFQKFYRVTGSSTQHRGVTPDIKLPTALSAEQFGESSSPSALPWDEIRGTLFQKTPVINDRVLTGLNKSYQDRLKHDQFLGKLVAETDDMRKNLLETKVSLNETVRKKEMEEAERKKAANDKLTTTINKETGNAQGNLKMEDEYLREGLFVLSDLINTKIG